MHLVLLLTAFLGISSLALGVTPERDDERRDDSAAAEAAAPRAGPTWGFELFARGGFAGVAANGGAVWAGTVFRVPDPFQAELHWEASQHDRKPLMVAIPVMNRADHPFQPERTKASADTLGVVPGAHPKSPCASPSAAAATRSLCPRSSRMSGSSPSRDGRGVVSQTHAA